MHDPSPKLINQEEIIFFYEIFPRLHPISTKPRKIAQH
jgi:hypothetical protein